MMDDAEAWGRAWDAEIEAGATPIARALRGAKHRAEASRAKAEREQRRQDALQAHWDRQQQRQGYHGRERLERAMEEDAERRRAAFREWQDILASE